MENATYNGGGVGLGDAMILSQGGCGGQFMWLVLLIALMGGGFGGWNNRGNDYVTAAQAANIRSDIYASNDQQDIKNGISTLRQTVTAGLSDVGYANMNGQNAIQRDIGQAACMLDKSIMQGNFGIERSITDNRYVLGNAINEGRFATQNGFNGVERNIDALRYDGAMNTCKITETDTFNTQKILDKLSSMEFNAMRNENENLRQQLAQANLAVSQCAQNQYLVNTISPCPKPAYIVPSPFVTNNGCGCCG